VTQFETRDVPRTGQTLETRQPRQRLDEHETRTGFLAVAEAAAAMRVSTMTVYRLIKAGDLASVRVGTSYRIREDDVHRYLAARCVRLG
jgi:excisionase family DNA binding protein